MDSNANKDQNEKGLRKQVTFSDSVSTKTIPKATSERDGKEAILIPLRSEMNPEKESPSNEKIVHSNLRVLDERRQCVWTKMDAVVEQTELMYQNRIASVKSLEKQLITTIQDTAKNTIASLEKNREILLETIAQKLQEFESLNKACEDDITTLNLMQNRLKETLDRVGFSP